MNEVPSSAILAVIAIVTACALGAFLFNTVQSQKTAGNAAMSKVEQMNAQLDEAEITQYDGQVVTGSQVVSALTMLKERGIVLTIHNGKNEATYYINPDADATAQKTDQDNWSKAMKNVKTRSSKYYITPSAQFQGSVIRDASGAIIQLTFSKVGGTAATAIAELPQASSITTT